MSNLSLVRFDQDGLELFVDKQTGKAYASIRATARMVGKAESTIRGFLTAQELALETAETPTVSGLKTARLLSSQQVFKVALKYNSDLAERMGSAGANVFLCGMAGYQVAIAATVQPKTALELAREQVKLLEQIELQQAQIKLLEADNERQAEAIDELFEHSSIIRVAKYNGCSEKAFSWHKLKAASKALNAEIKQVPCPRFVTKNLYSHDAWRLAYPEYRLPETTTIRIYNG